MSIHFAHILMHTFQPKPNVSWTCDELFSVKSNKNQQLNKQYLMKLQVVKNIQFSRLIKADDRLREFNFRKMGGLFEGIFSVDVADDRGNRILFKMQKEENTWKIIEKGLPFWITDSSVFLHEKIEEVMNAYRQEETTPQSKA